MFWGIVKNCKESLFLKNVFGMDIFPLKFKFLNGVDRKDLSVWLCAGVLVSPLVLPQ